MKFNLALIFSAFIFSAAHAADKKTYCMATHVEPNATATNFDQSFLKVAVGNSGDGTQNQIFLVNKEGTAGVSITADDFFHRRDNHTLNEFDGQTLVECQASPEGNCGITYHEVDSTTTKGYKGGSTSLANITTQFLWVSPGEKSFQLLCVQQ